MPIPIFPGDNVEPPVLRDADIPIPNPPPIGRTRASRARTRATSEVIQYASTLRPWMCAYAEWLTLECAEYPSRQGRRLKANQLSRATLKDAHVKALEARVDFRDYCDELQRGPLEAARAKFRSRFPEYVDAHYEALKAAQAEGDHRGAAQIADAALERIMPKKAEVAAATQVNITLSPAQVAGFNTEYVAPRIEAEVVAVTPATPVDD